MLLLSILYRWVGGLLGLTVVLARPELSKDAELLVLGHENAVWGRQISRVRYTRADWRASHLPDSGPNKVRPGMEDAECQNGAGSSARNTAMKQ